MNVEPIRTGGEAAGGRLSRASLERVLRQLLDGELTPEEAARWLTTESPVPGDAALGAPAPGAPTYGDFSYGDAAPGDATRDGQPAEPLASLIARLGAPPADVIEAWCERWYRAAAAHEAATGNPLPPIDLHRWSLSPSGELTGPGESGQHPRRPAADESSAIGPVSRRRIESLRRRLHGASAQPLEASPAELDQHSGRHEPRHEHGVAETTGSESSNSDEGRRDGAPAAVLPWAAPAGDRGEPASAADAAHNGGAARSRRAKGTSSLLRRPRSMAVAVVAVAAAGALGWLGSQPAARTTSSSTPATPAGSSAQPSTATGPATPGRSPSARSEPEEAHAAVRGAAGASAGKLETFQPLRPPVSSPTAPPSPASDVAEISERPSENPDALLTLDSLMPSSADVLAPPAGADEKPQDAERPDPLDEEDAAAEHAAAPASDDRQSDVPPQGVSAIGEEAPDGQEASEDAAEPSESPQPTQTHESAAVELPSIDTDSAAATLLASPAPESLELEFPLDVPLRLRSGPSPATWLVERAGGDDSDPPEVLARFEQDGTGLSFHWTPQAEAQRAMAEQLRHGRLVGKAGQPFYLRPVITAAPVAIRLDQRDVRPAWDLRHALPPGAARLSLSLALPENVRMRWIEAPDETSPRRMRASAQFWMASVAGAAEPEEGEDRQAADAPEPAEAPPAAAALALRLDVRCSRRLSIRLRYAARLDPALPWQRVSSDRLNRLTEQIASRIAALETQASQAAAQHRQAAGADKQFLKNRRKQLEQAAATLRRWAERAGELEALIAAIESSGALHAELSVAWPDESQTIFTTRPDASSTSAAAPSS